MKRPTVVTVIGARPQFIKAAPVSRALAAAHIREFVVHTGQHFDREMSDVFFEELGMAAADAHLGISGGGHGMMTGRMLEALECCLLDRWPDWVLVYGDTNSTLAGALAAAKLHIPVAHVEAGLRSFNRQMPEEINRVMTDHVSDLLLCPTRTAAVNLASEGITRGVQIVGDVMYDACLDAVKRVAGKHDILDANGLTPDEYVVATVHRAENVDSPDRLSDVINYLRDRAREHDVFLPIHPRTRNAISVHRIETAPIRVSGPVGYLGMAQLLANCCAVYTDSGGLQKEAYFHRKPCVTLRDETEWVETVECGWNRLWHGPDYAPRRPISEYGDGHAAGRIADALCAG